MAAALPVELICGEAMDVLGAMEGASVDALVTDPPAGIAFMGREWDRDHGGRAGWIATMTPIFAECLRVLKPGGHGLVWALPRTSHWTATALEDAGFEIRDRVTHLFGSGFPKSLDVSKAMDKAAGKLPDEGAGFVVAGEYGGRGLETPPSKGYEKPEPATDLARQWNGWGTALKPAAEDWWLVRKPLEGTVAANVEANGTGALNVDGCRIDAERTTGWGGKAAGGNTWNDANMGLGQNGEPRPVDGRWPANVTLDEEAAAMLDEQSGETGDNRGPSIQPRPTSDEAGASWSIGAHQAFHIGDSGGASRFYYTAKASSAERSEDVDGRNTHPTVKPVDLMRWLVRLITPPGGLVLDPFMGSGTTGVAARDEGCGFFGIERDPGSFAIAEQRIAQMGMALWTAGS